MDVPGLHVLIAAILVAAVSSNPCRDVNVTMKTSVENSCYFLPTESLTWTRARRECMTHGGHLAAVNRSSSMAAVRELQSRTATSDLWVGAVLQATGYKWDDGSALTGSVGDYPWSVPVETAAAADNCVYVDAQAGWRLGPCSANKAYICQFDEVNRNCSTSAGSDVITLGRSCYMVQYGAASWFLARAQCESVGGHVVRLGNVTVYQGVVGQLQRAPLYTGQELWTGLRRARWVWVTGEEVVWTAWESSQPDGAATCLSVHKYSPDNVLWRTAPCATALNYVCQRDAEPSTAVGSTTTTAPEGQGAGVQSGLLMLLLLLLVVLAVIVIFLVCYYRRGRALRKEARERAKERGLNSQNNNADVEYRPNYSIFTTSNDTNGQLPQSNGHVRLHNDIEKASTPDSLRQNGRMGDRDALIQNNNKPKGAKTNLNSSFNAKKRISKSASKYQDTVEGDYDFDADDRQFRNGKVSDPESVFKDISNFDPPLPAYMTAENETNVYHQTMTAGSSTPSLKRSNPMYHSSELFSVRSSMRIPLPKAQAEESLVMESIQADEQDEKKARDLNKQEEEDMEFDTDRSKYIEDVAKAFDFLVTGDGGSHPDVSVTANPPDPPAPAIKATKDGENLLKKRARRDSLRSVDKNYASGNESDKMEYDMAKAQRRLYGEKERAGSRRKKEKPDQGKVNGGFTGGESDVDEESRRRKHKHRSHAKEGATGGTDSELDDDRRNKHKHHRHKYTEEELEEKRRRRKERELKKQGTLEREKKIDVPEEDDGLTRVGSPPPLGKLPPLGPLAPINTDEKKKRHRDKHRKHRKDMTPEELEERRRHHKRKKEKERRRKERELQGKQVEPNRIQVSGKPQEAETEDSDGSEFTDDETGSVTGSAAGTPKKSPGSSSRTTDRSRRPSVQGGPVYDIDNLGAGEGFEV